ncbi:hypothetical protein ASD00_26800 [Ensifer sp. Root31]|uniref:hypothetical protein n=1 Tax=Ensifer sp. Root31 TaxID=1736512 RepID=UPI00070BD0F0|nr:hypothetical protein [Ensifer sp. Root31]KQU89467.1 hypothetical protein ASD00_26800 [Ensifer sp. Root31]
MYRILSKKALFVSFSWLVVGLLLLGQYLSRSFPLSPKYTAIPALAWIVLSTILWNPVWRQVWRWFPRLGRVVFPDLNGRWRVELCSNWPRQEQLLNAAMSKLDVIDMRHCAPERLAPLTPIILEAEITQTWWSFEMKMWNPQRDTPIKRSDTISVDPYVGTGLRPHGVCYFFKQTNETDIVSDDAEFYGAARLEYVTETDELEGLVWSARQWRRAMNTAGTVKFSRIG